MSFFFGFTTLKQTFLIWEDEFWVTLKLRWFPPTGEAVVVVHEYIPAPTNPIKLLALTSGVSNRVCTRLYITNTHTVTGSRIWEIFGKRAVTKMLLNSLNPNHDC